RAPGTDTDITPRRDTPRRRRAWWASWARRRGRDMSGPTATGAGEATIFTGSMAAGCVRRTVARSGCRRRGDRTGARTGFIRGTGDKRPGDLTEQGGLWLPVCVLVV